MTQKNYKQSKSHRKLILLLPIFIITSMFVIDDAQANVKTSIVGNFDGEHKHLEIDENKEDLMSFGNGQMNIGSKNFDYILRGEFFRIGIDPLNPICDKIFGFLTIVDEDVQLNLQLFGKNCRYGMTSYTFGTFIVYKIEGVDYEDGTGRFTMITDEHLTEKNTHNFYGQLQGSMTN